MEHIDNIDQIIDEIVDTIVSEYKDCNQCGITKLKNCFYKDKKTKDGLFNCCKDCQKAYDAKRYQENKDKIKARGAASYYEANKQEILAHNAKPENKAKTAEYNAAYSAKPESKMKRNARLTKRRKTDEGYRIEVNLRSRLKKAMNGVKKSASTLTLVGLQSGTAINNHLNLKSPWFKEQGTPYEELAIDHIIPCAEYKLEKPDHQKACFHYTNLQWLTKPDNERKGAKVPVGFDFKSTLKKQLDLIAHIEKEQLTYQQVLEKQKAGELYKVEGYEV